MSLFEMIPDETIPMPMSGCYGQAKAADKGFNLVEETCAQCDTAFFRNRMWKSYKRMRNGRVLRFCSWGCVCRWTEAQEAKKKPKGEKKKRDKAQIQERIDTLMRDMARIRTMLDSEAGRAMSQEDRNREHSKIRWRACEMKRLLEEMEDAGTGSMRGIAGGNEGAAAPGA